MRGQRAQEKKHWACLYLHSIAEARPLPQWRLSASRSFSEIQGTYAGFKLLTAKRTTNVRKANSPVSRLVRVRQHLSRGTSRNDFICRSAARAHRATENRCHYTKTAKIVRKDFLCDLLDEWWAGRSKKPMLLGEDRPRVNKALPMPRPPEPVSIDWRRADLTPFRASRLDVPASPEYRICNPWL